MKKIIFLNLENVNIFQANIIEYYLNNSRKYPWRATKDPFKILVAELLLKRTGAWKAKAVYQKIINMYGTPYKMANADVETLKELIQPLGMIKRAQLLTNISEEILNKFNGKIPANFDKLTELNGVGRYTANAILCMAFDKSVPLVDESIKRVFRRFFNYQSKKKAYCNSELWSFASSILPTKKVKEYNLGLLDFAAIKCKPRNPTCYNCELKSYCLGQFTKLKNLSR